MRIVHFFIVKNLILFVLLFPNSLLSEDKESQSLACLATLGWATYTLEQYPKPSTLYNIFYPFRKLSLCSRLNSEKQSLDEKREKWFEENQKLFEPIDQIQLGKCLRKRSNLEAKNLVTLNALIAKKNGKASKHEEVILKNKNFKGFYLELPIIIEVIKIHIANAKGNWAFKNQAFSDDGENL